MREIEGYNNYYVTEYGDVWNGSKFICKWVDNVGYYQVCLFKEGKKNYVRVHRLVAQCYVKKEEGCKFVNHKDGNKLNNHISNLEWCTNSQNTKHGYDIGAY